LTEESGISPEAARRSLERVVAGSPLAASVHLKNFLRYIVEETLAGRADNIKEYTIGVEVYKRGADFNPKADAIVRVEAGRLRAKLTEYYAGAGSSDPIRIVLPKGSYVPGFRMQGGVAAPDRRLRLRSRRLVIGLAGLLVLAMAVIWTSRARHDNPRLFALAVLPLAPLSAEPGTPESAEAMTEHLTLALSEVDGFRVTSRTSASRFKGKPLDPAAIGRELGVDAFLEGGVQRPGGRTGVTAQLIATRDGFHLWSQKYESKPESEARFQETVCNIIARTLGAQFAGNPARWSGRPRSSKPEAVDLYLKGHQAWLVQRRTSLLASVDYFTQAIARDPDYAQAYSGLAQSELFLASITAPEPKWIAPAKEAAERAIALDERDPDAHAILGNIHLWREWDPAGGERELYRALVLDPGTSAYERWYALAASVLGRHDKALEELAIGEMANPGSEVIKTELGRLHYELGHWDEAWRYAQKALPLAPQYQLTHLLRGLLHEQKRDYPAAISEFKACVPPTAVVAGPRSAPFLLWCQAALAHTYAISGAPLEARKLAQVIQDRYLDSNVSLALVHLALGDRTRALNLVEQAFRERELYFLLLKSDPRFASLRAEPRCQTLLRRIGL
jgi:TolB-like protein/tetratricopeptide (TPR) repeat protein